MGPNVVQGEAEACLNAERAKLKVCEAEQAKADLASRLANAA